MKNKGLLQLTVGSNPIALKSDVHAETRRYKLPPTGYKRHANILMPTRSIMNIANLNFYFWGGCVPFSAFSASPRELAWLLPVDCNQPPSSSTDSV
jgi:hypothetical protein